jgi:predicted ChrR family anti-sigma factor
MSHTAAHEELEELAALYALGALDAAEARAFEAHLAGGCAACSAELRGFDHVVAQLALAAPAVEPPAGVREKLLSRVAGEGREDAGEARGAAGHTTSPSVGPSEFLVVRGDEGRWEQTADRGVYVKLLFADRERDTVTTLVRLEPGASIPPHRHLGVEQCLVVEGSMRAGQTVLRAGDFNCAMKGTIHEEIHSDEGALLMIVAPESYEVLGRGGEQSPHA